MELNDIKVKLDSVKIENTYLYFVTRLLKSEIKKTAKVLNKYIFKVYQIDINDEIQKHLHSLTLEQLAKLIEDKIDLHEYDVVSDDTEQFFSYSITNKTLSFADVVNNQLKVTPPKIKNLEDIIAKEELWAYCVGFFIKESDWIYTFRKILSGKVAINEKNGNKRNVLQKILRTRFNTNNQKLELIEGETVNLDKHFDCIFYLDTFYITKKAQFEQIVCLEEEFKLQASEVLSQLESINIIDGIDILSQQVETNPSIHKKLVRLSKIGNYKEIDEKTIKKMQKVCKSFGESLKVKNNKLLIEDEKDIDLTLKMLSDYYKRGEVSGKAYGTFAGKQLNSRDL